MASPTSQADSADTTYPLSKQLKVTYSPYEDRLVVKSNNGPDGAVALLLSRRMVMIVLQQLLAKLPGLSGLDKTPTQYWQEVLSMAHQHAMQSKQQGQQTAPSSEAPSDQTPAADISKSATGHGHPAIYLATELTVKLESKRLILAFKGLPMPQAMTVACAPEPVFALPLLPGHAHQLIELLITKAQKAHWHLPLDLPWLENPNTRSTSLDAPSLH